MDTKDSANVIMLPVKLPKFNITLDDYLSALAKKANDLNKTHSKSNKELAPLLQKFGDLSSQLHEVVTKINHIDPTILVSKSKTVPPKK
jgi:hypothetical protein